MVLIAGGLYEFSKGMSDSTPKFDQTQLQNQLSAEISQEVGVTVTVSCPANIPFHAGRIDDCTADDGTNRRLVRVTQNDSRGHFTFVVTDQSPG